MCTFIAIDPGKTGAIAYVKDSIIIGWRRLHFELIRHAAKEDHPILLEKVQGSGRRSDFNFGVHYGFIQGLLDQNQIIFVRPQFWQRGLEVSSMPSVMRKQRIQKLAFERHPHLEDITLYAADAIMIADYGIRKPDIFTTTTDA